MFLILRLSAGLVDYTLFSFLAERGWTTEASHTVSLLVAMSLSLVNLATCITNNLNLAGFGYFGPSRIW